MEYLPGNDLARELSERGPLSVVEAVDYVLQACVALAEAHDKGIVHRDLKPANLFLAQRPNGGRMIKVLDFGISKFTGAGSRQFSLTDTSTLMGSPAYMSPEQLESSRNVDGRADIWSLGVILHELISGKLPFVGESVVQLVRAIVGADRLPLTSRHDVPPALEVVVACCLTQDRELRFANIQRLREALLPFSSATSATAVGTSTSPGVAPPTVSGAVSGSSPGASASGLEASPGSPADRHSRSASTSWGNTQRGSGWRQAMSRRVVAGLALAAAAVGAAYYLGGGGSGSASPDALAPDRAAADSSGQSAASVVGIGPTPTAPAEPRDAPEAATEPALEAEVEPGAEPGESVPPPSAPAVAPASEPPAPKAPRRAEAVRPAVVPMPSRDSAATGSPEPAEASRPAPKPPRKIEIPDFGGRE
jgi:serine/threonine-protein kinase